MEAIRHDIKKSQVNDKGCELASCMDCTNSAKELAGQLVLQEGRAVQARASE